jgi:secreted trypsin-like serine protease
MEEWVKRLALVVAVAAILVLPLPAGAITDGKLDGNGHPYVGLMVAQDKKGNPLWRCSGTMMSPTVFLTAGHCTEAPATQAQIWFAADVESGIPGNGYPLKGDAGGKTFTHPSYNPNAFFLFDLGVVVLSKPVSMPKYGALPKLDVLSAMATKRGLQNVTFTSVGYGLQQINPVFVQQDRVRMVANPHLIQIDGGIVGDYSIMLSNNHSTGGTCFGDSGGPNFIGSSNVVGGVTSFGLNGNCAGTGGVYRVDKADDLNWLKTFGLG